MGDLSPCPHNHLTQRSPENHTSPTQIITVQGVGGLGTPPVAEQVFEKGTGVRKSNRCSPPLDTTCVMGAPPPAVKLSGAANPTREPGRPAHRASIRPTPRGWLVGGWWCSMGA